MSTLYPSSKRYREDAMSKGSSNLELSEKDVNELYTRAEKADQICTSLQKEITQLRKEQGSSGTALPKQFKTRVLTELRQFRTEVEALQNSKEKLEQENAALKKRGGGVFNKAKKAEFQKELRGLKTGILNLEAENAALKQCKELLINKDFKTIFVEKLRAASASAREVERENERLSAENKKLKQSSSSGANVPPGFKTQVISQLRKIRKNAALQEDRIKELEAECKRLKADNAKLRSPEFKKFKTSLLGQLRDLRASIKKDEEQMKAKDKEIASLKKTAAESMS